MKVTAAVTAMTRTAVRLCTATDATTKPLAAMSPIEIGSRPAWIAPRHGAFVEPLPGIAG